MKRIWVVVAISTWLFAGASHGQEKDTDVDISALIAGLGLEESEAPVRELPYWRKPQRIYIEPPGYTEEERARQMREAHEAVGDVELIQISRPIPEDVVRDAEVLISSCTHEIIRNAVHLRWFQHRSHGVESCIIPGIENRPFLLTNTQHTSAPPMADHVIALMMTLTRGVHHFHRLQSQGRWGDDEVDFPMLELGDKTMLIVGLGGVGMKVAEHAHGLGMRVMGIRRSSRDGPPFVDYIGLPDELHELAGQADVIVNILPLTHETTGIFNQKSFNAARRGAYYISVGRGKTTVTEDLLAALNDGRIEGAGLDVTDPEPLPANHELWQHPNVIITPHVAAETDQGRWRRWIVIRENLRRYVAGEKMLNVVDLSKGY